MGIFGEIAKIAAYQAALLAWKVATDELIKQSAKILPFMQSLAEGSVVIPESLIQRLLNRSMSNVEEIKNIKVEFKEELISANLVCEKKLAMYDVCFTFEIQKLRVGKEEQVAEFRILEDIDIKGRNLIGWASARIAFAIISGAVQSDENASRILEKTDGLVELSWPLVIIHLDKHSILKKAGLISFKDLVVWDIVEITGCNIKPGSAILQLLQHDFVEKQKVSGV